MSRHFPDWLTAFVQYASFSEAPPRMHFWSGVSAVAGALRRKVWIPQGYFSWHCNMYIVLVAPPGVVGKSTTSNIALSLLRRVPGIKFGPDIVTWQALVTAFANSNESFPYVPPGQTEPIWIPMCALTIEASEFGNLVNPSERESLDLFVSLWDSKTGPFTKLTKGSGNDNVENPWINIIACTTPAWIAGTFPEYVIGGGFTSRCLFVYADQKEKYVAYPARAMPPDFQKMQDALVQDLEHIASSIAGPYELTPQAIELGEEWYQFHWKNKPEDLDDDRFQGYISRKQTHVHKTAMILAASQRDELIITDADLAMAVRMVTDLERDMQKIFSRIGRTHQSVQAERFIKYVHRKGIVSYPEAYQYVHSAFPDLRNFEGVVSGAMRAGFIERIDYQGVIFLKARQPGFSPVIIPGITPGAKPQEPINGQEVKDSKGPIFEEFPPDPT